MNTCHGCVYWGMGDTAEKNYYDSIISPIDPDTYEPMKLPFEVKYCRCPKITFYERPIDPSGATMVDGSEYKAALITGPEFGCVHWFALPID